MPDSKKKSSEYKSRSVRLSTDRSAKDESSLYGDEADISFRRKKTNNQSSPKKSSDKSDNKNAASSSDSSSKAHSHRPTNYPKFAPNKSRTRRKHRHSKRSFFEVINASDNNRLFRPIRIFGHEIRFWPLLLLAVIALLASGVMLNNNNLQVVEETVTIVGLPESMEGYRIVVLSDMNAKRFGDSQSQLLRTINNMKYDLIFCTGDMVGKSGNPEPFYEFLEGLRYPERVYFICGDQDPGPFVSSARNISDTLENLVLEDWILGAKARGANYVDRPISVAVKNTTLWITPATMLNLETVSSQEDWQEQHDQEYDGTLSGIVVDHDSLPFTDYRRQQISSLYDSERNMAVSDMHISLAHEVPSDEFIYISQEHEDGDRYLSTPELIIAGHYCGGVWRIPFLGPIYVPDRTLDRNGWFPSGERVSGLNAIGDTQVYITRGLSTNGSVAWMPFRLFNGPEVAVLTLTATLPENLLGTAQ